MPARHEVSDEHQPGLSHRDGIKAHVVIELSRGVDVFDAFRAIKATRVRGRRGNKLTLIEVHLGLGEYDMIADIHCKWTTPRGDETRQIGEWVNAARKQKPRGGTEPYIKRTSTLICINVGG